jgi:hypothetical protein
MSLPVLKTLVGILRANDCQMVYNRPVQFVDNSQILELGDFEWLAEHAPDVVLLRDIAAANPELSYNEMQLRVFAHADHAISVQGGPATFAGYFCQGGDIIVLHKRGGETRRDEYNVLYERFDGAAYTVTRSDEAFVAAVQDKARHWRLE